MEIHARGEQIRIPSQAKRRKVAAVAAAPQADARWINFGPRLEILSSRGHVLVFAGAAACTTWRFAEASAVSDAAAIVDRQDHIPATRQILVHAVRVRVVVHVVPAEQHLPHGPAMKKQQARALFPGLHVVRQEQLTMDLEAIRRWENNRLRDD